MSDTILTDRQGGVTRITLNRPDKLNAFNEEMHLALRAALEGIEADPNARAVLLTGAGRGFCAGQDLGDREMAEGEAFDLGDTLERLYNPLIRRIRALPKPIICSVNGAAAGAGASLALACDIVLAARSAKFLIAFARIGLVPDSGGTWFLPRLIGEARTKGMALLAEPVDAETAERWGLIWKAVDDDALAGEAEALAARMAAGPTQGYAMIKQALHESPRRTLDDQLDLERDLQRAAGHTEDYREGVTAFLEKRKAVFKGG